MTTDVGKGGTAPGSRFSFFIQKHGLKSYLEVAIDDVPAKVVPDGNGGERLLQPITAMLLQMNELADWLKEHGWEHDSSFDKPGRGGGGGGGGNRAPKAPPTVQNDAGETVEVVCDDCGGPVYDNRDENIVRKSKGQKERPDFACKDKDGCGWVKWPRRS